MKRRVIVPLVVLAVILLGGAGYLGARSVAEPRATPSAAPQTVDVTRGDVQQTVTAPGKLILTKQTVLSFDISGKLTHLDLQPGDRVQVGQSLAQLDSAPLVQALEKAQLELSLAEVEHTRELADAEWAVRAAELRLEESRIDRARQIFEAERALQIAQIQLAQARIRYPDLTVAEIDLKRARADEAYAHDEYKKSLDRPWEPQAMRDGALRTWNDARDTLAIEEAEYQAALDGRAAKDQELPLLGLDVEQAEGQLAELRAGGDPFPAFDLHRAEETLAGLRARSVDPLLYMAVEQAQADLDAATLAAPSDGIVLEVKAGVGAMVNAGTPLIVLADPADVEIIASVIEEDVPLVASGQAVELFFDAAPDQMPVGVVARLVPQRISGDRPLYPIYITPKGDLPDGLFPGMTVDASIIVAQRTSVLRFPRSLLRSRPDGTAVVQVWSGLATRAQEVTIGLRGDAYVEILYGLQEGDRVVAQ